jgi:hypothetical protein
MACEQLKAAYDKLEGQITVIEVSIKETPIGDTTTLNLLNAQLTTAKGQASTTLAAYNACLAALKRVPGAQPAEILQIQFQNPAFPPAGAWGSTVVSGSFPIHTPYEWTQVLNPTFDYDQTPVGVSGWAIFQDLAGTDSPGLHPFGNDWEFYCALDAAFQGLCPSQNLNLSVGKDVKGELTELNVSQNVPQDVIDNVLNLGFLGVEWDSGLVPQGFQDEFQKGDRVAVFGRWIVDCGEDFHTEIHPPMLLASASVHQPTQASPLAPRSPPFTRALFTSRPYLVGQMFVPGNQTDQIYEDQPTGDGAFFDHFLHELENAAGDSLRIEAHPKIKQLPFHGVQQFTVVVGTTQIDPIPLGHLNVSFHFTVRGGCTVQVLPNDASSVRVVFSLNNPGYTPPPLPTRNDLSFSVSDINNLASAGFWTKLIEGLSAAYILGLGEALLAKALLVAARGFLSDRYDALPPVDFRDTDSPDAVLNAPVSSISPGIGVTVNNGQPYPVVGWLELSWAPTVLAVGH